MLIFLLALAGFAFLDSLDVLLVGVTMAVVYDSRLSRRSAVPGALSFRGCSGVSYAQGDIDGHEWRSAAKFLVPHRGSISHTRSDRLPVVPDSSARNRSVGWAARRISRIVRSEA
nr:hypothetical protein [Nocardia aurantiaca]